MRHIRQRQLKKVNGIVENNRIDLLNQFNPALDKSFKWVRINLRNGVHNMIFCRDSLDMWTVIVPK